MHSANIVHRDIKPENILINSDCHIKICDLGMSRAIDFETDPTMSTNYVVTRYYRAPELLLNNDEVSRAMDVWAAGCVFGELINGRIVFSGESPIDQIMSIIRKLGTPNTSDIKASHEGMMFMKQQKHYDAIPFEQLFPKADAVTVDLLSKLLVFNHEQRITAAEALKHPYFDEVYGCNIGNTDTDGLYMAKSKFDFSFEDNLTDEEAVKQKTYETILEFHRLKKAKSFRPRKKDLETLVVDLQNELQKKEQENADLSRQVTLFKKMVNKDIAQNSQLSYQLSVSPRSSRVSSSRRSTEQHKSKCCFQ
jgi:serine/threonine protein kinase